jgi:hypothetical protein
MRPLEEVQKIRNVTGQFTHITIGRVVDTNDPQQMGRLRVACPIFGDLEEETIRNIPWATYVSPLAGSTETPARGRGSDQTAGPVAYGMFNIPKVGSNVLIACIDGDPRFRVWLGCVHDQLLTHTMPHGRYSYQLDNQPEGPFSSSEDEIEPLYTSQTNAFTNPSAGVEPRKSYEFRTRAADVSVSGLDEEFVDTETSRISLLSDDFDVESEDGKYTNTQGYKKSRVEPDGKSAFTRDILYDPQTYSWTTPGFHSVSMTDNAENCRIRIRTTHGTQVILDDTNERIYISTANGKNWFEMDESSGNIDMYADGNVSVRSKKDINFTADKSFRVTAQEGIHLSTPGETRIYGGTGVHMKSETTLNLHSEEDFNIFSGVNANITSFVDTNINAGGNVVMTGAEIHENGPPAASVSDTQAQDSYLSSRVPDHEPWARTMTKDDTTHEPEFSYDDDNVGKSDRGETITRNSNWQR